KPVRRVSIGGVGFVFDNQPDENGLVLAGVDFDGAISPEVQIASLAAERVKKLGSYYEASVSGTGLHVIVKARPLASGIAHDGVELYTSGRFFTMTGRTSQAAGPVIAAPDAFAALAEELRNHARRPGPQCDRAVPTSPEFEPDLNDFESAAYYLASLKPSPFQDYHEWRDFMFACAHAEI